MCSLHFFSGKKKISPSLETSVNIRFKIKLTIIYIFVCLSRGMKITKSPQRSLFNFSRLLLWIFPGVFIQQSSESQGIRENNMKKISICNDKGITLISVTQTNTCLCSMETPCKYTLTNTSKHTQQTLQSFQPCKLWSLSSH